MTNYMEQVAQMLGVEIGEKFHIDYFKDCTFYITNKGLFSKEDDEDANVPYILRDLLNGRHEIRKIPKRKHTGLEDVEEGDTVFELSGAAFTSPFMGLLAPSEFMDRDIRDNWRRYIAIKKRLAKAASELNTEPIDWNDCRQEKWFICCRDHETLTCYHIDGYPNDGVFFTSKEAAQKAIEIVGENDLIWMLRDFQAFIGYLAEVSADE